nr:right-handed parallel beta-helix repeat-containing protein [Corynebacterium lemuris]
MIPLPQGTSVAITLRKLSSVLTVPALALSALVAFSPAAQAATVNVDCNAGGNLAQAVLGAADGDTLQVSGTCDETVFVPRTSTNLTIDGGGTATIAGPDASAPPTGPASFTFFVEGTGLTLKGMTITGGAHAVHLSGPASATILDNTITDSAGAIHLDKDSTGQIGGNTIVNNLGYGINIQENSYARIGFTAPTRGHLPNVIKDNQGPGIIVKQWSGAWISGNEITDNAGHGVEVDRGSHAEIYDNDISNNAGDGIRAANGSGINFEPINSEAPSQVKGNTTHTPNRDHGLVCSTGGYVAGERGSLNGKRGAELIDAGCVTDRKTGQPVFGLSS